MATTSLVPDPSAPVTLVPDSSASVSLVPDPQVSVSLVQVPYIPDPPVPPPLVSVPEGAPNGLTTAPPSLLELEEELEWDPSGITLITPWTPRRHPSHRQLIMANSSHGPVFCSP